MVESQKIKFNVESVNSEYLRDWLGLLCNTEKRSKEFIDNFLDDKNLFDSAFRYQRYLRNEEGRGKEITIKHLKKAIEEEDLKTLTKLLQEMFIEPIYSDAVNHFFNLVKRQNHQINDFIKLYKSDKDRGFSLTIKKLMQFRNNFHA